MQTEAPQHPGDELREARKDEMGHADAKMTMGVYRQAMRRDDAEKAALRGLVDGAVTAIRGNRGAEPVEAETLTAAA